MYDVIVVGAGPAGVMSAISARKTGQKVLLLEKLSDIGSKLKATGGGKCNLTNRLDFEKFILDFGKNGRFISDALRVFGRVELLDFFSSIGVKTRCRDGFRIFPDSHSSKTVLRALKDELKRLHVEIQCSNDVKEIRFDGCFVVGEHKSKNLIVATGGLGYPKLGASKDGYMFAKRCGHKITELSPGMMPLNVKEKWVENCRADTVPKALIRVGIRKYKNLKAVGDLIFTKNGIRGPVVLDFSREITPLLKKYGEIPLHVSMIKDKNEEEIFTYLKKSGDVEILKSISCMLAKSISQELLKIVDIDFTCRFKNIDSKKRDRLVKILAKTPLHVDGHDGFEKAMITRGGVSLKEIDPKTMQSRLQKGLYFCGEIVDIDGPCGGYNLQWSFSSGYLAGLLKNGKAQSS